MFQKTLTGGRYNESNYPVQELWRKRGGGGRIFEGGVLVGHYGNYNVNVGEHNMKILTLVCMHVHSNHTLSVHLLCVGVHHVQCMHYSCT